MYPVFSRIIFKIVMLKATTFSVSTAMDNFKALTEANDFRDLVRVFDDIIVDVGLQTCDQGTTGWPLIPGRDV